MEYTTYEHKKLAEEIQELREEVATLKKDSHAKDENLGEDSPELIELKKKWWD